MSRRRRRIIGGSGTAADVTAPTITSANAVNVAENSALSHTLTANEVVTWTKIGGADAALFTLIGNGVSMAAKDFEVPTDDDADNAYVVIFRATDAASNFSDQTFTATVTAVAEVAALTNAIWATNAADTTPGFDFDLPGSALAGDNLIAEVSGDGLGVFTTYFSHTLTAQDIIDDQITINGVSVLAEGAYDFRFRLERSGEAGPWTSLVDVTINLAPTVSSFNPTDGATGVSVGSNLVVTFNKSVQFGTGTINLFDSDNDLIESFSVTTEVGSGAGQVQISGAALTINPTASMEANKVHYIKIDATAVQNLNAIAFAGIADTTTWNFTTVSYVQKFVDNNGTGYFTGGNNFLPTDTAFFTFSATIKRQADGVFHNLFRATGRSDLFLTSGNKLNVTIKDTANAVVYQGTSTRSIVVADGTVHVHVKVDLTVPSVVVTINDAAETMTSVTGPLAGTGLIDHTRTGTPAYGFLSTEAAGNKADVHVSDFYIATHAAVSASTFHSGGNPADPTSNGSYGGTQPAIFLGELMTADARSGNAAQGWNDGFNIGAAGNLTVGSATFTDA